ncbi:MAG: hypothetical protein K6G03_01020 [Lachnospiraceae bacterium]|nr:hypothetical protein [Lachnospiraceae bacterium]
MSVSILTSCGKDNEDKQIILTTGFEDDEIFFIGDNKCYMPEARVYIRALQTGYSDKYGPEFLNRQLGELQVSDKLIGLALSRLAQVKAMDLLAVERGLSLTEREEEKCLQAAERYMRSLSDEDRRDLDVDQDTVLGMFEDYALAAKVYDDITKDINPEISDDEARTITVQIATVTDPDQNKAMQIANTIFSRVSDGENIDAVSDEFAEAETAKHTFGKDTTEFSPDFVEQCFNLSTDQISSPMVMNGKVYLVKCLSSFNREETDANKIRIVTERKSEAFDQIYQEYVKGLYAAFNDKLWDDQMFLDRTLDSKDDFFRIYDDVFAIL